MSGTLFKEVSYTLSKLIQDIDMGEIGLPDIQRPFVWPNAKVRDLFDSMYKGFPVGYLLFWANGMVSDHRQIGTEVKQKAPRLLIVDGQQRLTSLYSVIKNIPVVRDDFSKENIHIAFRPKDQTFEVSDAAIRRDPEFISDISALWSGAVPRNRFVKEFFKRLREARSVTEDEEDQLSEVIDKLYDLQSYPFTALELSQSVDEENVAEVFVRINSKGTPLNQADFILTLMSVFWDEGRAELEQFCRDARQPSTSGASPFNYFIQPDPDQLLRVSVGLGFRRARLKYAYSILRGKDLDTEEFSDERRIQQFKILKETQHYVLDLTNWHEFLKALLQAGYRRADMISSENNLLFSYVFYLIGKRDFKLDHFTLRNLIARWFFMASLTSRYTGSFESVMEQDLSRLRDIASGEDFIAFLDKIICDALTEDFWNIRLPNDLATSSPRSPSLSAYHAALNLMDADVLFSRVKVSELLDPATKSKKSAIERHHLFPKKYLSRIGITSLRDTNQIANYALVEWADNISISDKSPSEYYPEIASRFSSEELERMQYCHGLPSGWEKMEYHNFLEVRRREIAKIIRTAFEKYFSIEQTVRSFPSLSVAPAEPSPNTQPKVASELSSEVQDVDEGEDDDDENGVEDENTYDRSYWEGKSSYQSMQMVDECLEILREIDEGVLPNLKKRHIGLMHNGKKRNFIVFAPKKKYLRVGVKYNNVQSLEDAFKKTNLEISKTDKRRGRLWFEAYKGEISENRDFLEKYFSESLRQSVT